jgi:integrase
MRKTLTDSLLRSVKAPATGRLEIADLKCTGLSFRVTEAGARSWCFRFRDPESGKTTRAGLGDYSAVSLSDARGAGDALRKAVAAGINPVVQRRQNRDGAPGRTFGTLADRYLAEIRNPQSDRFKRSAEADGRNLAKHVLPAKTNGGPGPWRGRPYASIARADIIELCERLVNDGKPVLANRVQSLVSNVFTFAIDRDLVTVNPCARLRKRGAETAGTRVLSDGELALFWNRIIFAPVSRRVGLALRLVLLTAARPGEVAGLRRDELTHIDDPRRAAWTLPGERTKNGRAHLVPLSAPAIETIRAALELIEDDNPFVFASPAKDGTPITAHALAVALARFAGMKGGGSAGKSWIAEPPTPHDLRRTCNTRLAALGTPQEIRDRILNHTPRGTEQRHYNVHDFSTEKRAALDRWAAALASILKPARVISIKAARAGRQ